MENTVDYEEVVEVEDIDQYKDTNFLDLVRNIGEKIFESK